MASADFLQFVVTAASEPNLPPSARPPLVLTHSFSPCNCLIYWQRFRTAIGREIVWHPCPRCLPYEIPVRQFRDLPAPSFRFHLAVDTLGVRLYPSRCRADSGLSPVGTCARRAHQNKRRRLTPPSFFVYATNSVASIERLPHLRGKTLTVVRTLSGTESGRSMRQDSERRIWCRLRQRRCHSAGQTKVPSAR